MAVPDSQHTISRSSILYGSSKEDVWYDLDQFYNDHIQEIYHRISNLDDEIWGKIILMEKNKRVAKAYLRIPMVLIDGSCNGFNGQRIGFCSFENSARDRSVEDIRNKIGSGVILKMDQKGNMLAKRVGATPVIVQGADRSELFCFGNELAKAKGRLEVNQPVKVFDMKLFRSSIEQELQKPYPDRKRLMFQTLLRISLVKDEQHPFKTPCWFTVINLVALDMLVNKVPTMPTNLPDPLIFSLRQDETLTDMQREQLLNQSSCDLYGTLTPMQPKFANKQMINYSGHWSEMTKSPSSEFMDQMSRSQTQRQKVWKTPGGGYMSEAEGTKLLHRRGRSSEPRIRPVSQCWSAVPSVENLNLYSTIDNIPSQNDRNFGVHTLKPTIIGGKKIFSTSNNVSYFGPIKSNGWICGGSSSDYDSSNRMEIYESSNSSSNSGLSGSCRPSSPSIVSEASESQTSDSGFADTDAISSTRIASPSSSSHDKDLKVIVKNGSSTLPDSLDKLRVPCHRNVLKTTDLAVIDIKSESIEYKEVSNERMSNLILKTTKLETKPTVNGDKSNHPVPPARRRHQSQNTERNSLPLSLAPTCYDSDDDSDSTKVYSF